MNTVELAKSINRTGILHGDTVPYRVRIVEVKQSYGVVRYQVRAISGGADSSAWVNADRVSLDEVGTSPAIAE